MSLSSKDTARLRGQFTQAKKGNGVAIALAVAAGLVIAGARAQPAGGAGPERRCVLEPFATPEPCPALLQDCR